MFFLVVSERGTLAGKEGQGLCPVFVMRSLYNTEDDLMNALYNFIMAEYSLIISIAGTVVGLVISLVGAAYSEDKIKKIGWSCIAFFVVLCVVILTLKIAFGNDKGVTDTNGNPYQPTLGPGSAETSESTPEPKP